MRFEVAVTRRTSLFSFIFPQLHRRGLRSALSVLQSYWGLIAPQEEENTGTAASQCLYSGAQQSFYTAETALKALYGCQDSDALGPPPPHSTTPHIPQPAQPLVLPGGLGGAAPRPSWAEARARCGVGLGAMGPGQNYSVKAEWVAAVSLAAGAAAVGYLAYKKFISKDKCLKAMVNPHIQKDNPKVVHAFDMEDLGDKAVYCRCWRSKKFPLCDGSHTKHNEETGDNVGPLIIKRKEA
uniref:CDGSH iron-sulfur domain-containing protein 2 n=3 Tax=Catharus TaxID=9184 RepID=A0A8C3TT01_CATUS